MTQRITTPSKVSAWLECPHYLTLQSRVEDGSLKAPKSVYGSFADLVMKKGLEHEGLPGRIRSTRQADPAY